MSQPDVFIAALEEALKHYPDAAWLGQHSPLASPYLLGLRLTSQDATATVRGRTLQELLAEAAQDITGKYSNRYQAILKEYYFAGRTAVAAADIIGLGKNRFHQARNAAIEALNDALIRRLRPALRLEAPIEVPQIVGRDEEFANALTALNRSGSVVIHGNSGTGKTVQLTRLAHAWSIRAHWYPLRLNLNDHADSFLFSFGLYMHHLGASTLWQELVASAGQIDLEKALAMIRFMVEQVQFSPLLCIDNCEILEPSDVPHHSTLCELLQGISEIIPICAAGQSVPLYANHFIHLDSLSVADSVYLLEQLLDTANVNQSFTQADLTQIAEYTGGNPRLLTLCATYLWDCKESDSLDQLLNCSPAVEQLLDQIITHLGEAEKQQLLALSVFRTPVPYSIWETDQEHRAIAMIERNKLCQLDAHGGIELIPIYRNYLYQKLPNSARRHLHLMASKLRQSHAAYTAAAYHLIQADLAEAGLWQWKERRDQEVAQGQAPTALRLFSTLLQNDEVNIGDQRPGSDDSIAFGPKLSSEGETLLTIICSDLDRLVGNTTTARTTLQQTAHKNLVLSVEADELSGIIANDESRFEDANRAFQRGLHTAEKLIETRVASIHKGLGWMHFRQRDLALAERHLTLAHIEVENMRGNLAYQRCEYNQAMHHYQNALNVATEAGMKESEAKVRNNLATIHLLHGDFEPCEEQISLAIDLYESIGKLAAHAGCKITQSVAYNQAGQHQRAVGRLTEAAHDLSTMFDPPVWLVGLQKQALGEAYLGLSQFELAEEFIQAVIAMEEIDLLPDAHRTLGEIWLAQGKLGEAEVSIRQSIELATQNEDAYLGGYAQRAIGRLHLAKGQTSDANAALREAIGLFREMDLEYEVLKTEELLNKLGL